MITMLKVSSYSPRKHQISDSQAIPGRVLEEPVVASSVVNKDHDQNADSETQQMLSLGLSTLFI